MQEDWTHFRKLLDPSEDERNSTPTKSPEIKACQLQWRKPPGPGDPQTKVNGKNGKTYYLYAKCFGGHWQKYHLTSEHVSKESSANIAVPTPEDSSQLTSSLTMVSEGASK